MLRILCLPGDDGTGSGMELWKSDATAGGTSLAKDINNGPGSGSDAASSSPSMMVAMGDNIYFAADERGCGDGSE